VMLLPLLLAPISAMTANYGCHGCVVTLPLRRSVAT